MRVSVKPFELRVTGYDRQREPWVGTLLTLANGRLGVRGELELEEWETGTLLAGYYVDVPIWRRELALLPRINAVYAVQHGGSVNISSVERRLDMRSGLAETNAILTTNGTSFKFRSLNAAHGVKKNMYMQRIQFSGLPKGVTITLPLELATNPFIWSNTRLRHFKVEGVSFEEGAVVLDIAPSSGGERLRIASVVKARNCREAAPFRTSMAAGLSLSGCGGEVDIERYTLVSRRGDAPLSPAELRWEELIESHQRRWKELWEELGLEVDGEEWLAGGITFYTYHLLQLIDEEAEALMIPSRGLHGLGYKGHVFWDTDLYLALFFSALYPSALKKTLRFRCKTLLAAKEYALATGYQGARFPWEAVDDGYESTPRYIPVLEGGKCYCADILTGEKEVHVTADVALAADLYHRFTGDWDFLTDCGLKLIVETARYWVSRAVWDVGKQAYVVKDVIGPDEYHVGVDNNYYTNALAKYNLERAAELVMELLGGQGESKQVSTLQELGVSIDEALTWRSVGSKMYLSRRQGLVIEQFEGFFDLQDDEPRLEGLPRRVPLQELSRLAEKKVIKQADVVLALLLQDLLQGVPREEMKANFDYYFPRTTHESSLSIPVYAAVAAALKLPEAHQLLRTVVSTDIQDLYGNTWEGFHVAAAGGFWLTLLYGVLGLRIRGGELKFVPSCPDGIRKLSVKVKFRGNVYAVTLQCGEEPRISVVNFK
ncbi:MAG: glycosyl hydrolase family 65 protein [Infirmifilum sp.]